MNLRGLNIIAISAFIFMVLQRSVYNSMLDWSKVDGKYKYEEISLSLAGQIASAIVALAIVYFQLGFFAVNSALSNWRKLIPFILPGFLYSIDDMMEMFATSMFKTNVLYTILSQFKLVMSAVFMIYLVKINQTKTQWFFLALITVGLAGASISTLGNTKKSEQTNVIIGIVLSIGKVIISCIATVVCERSMKFEDSPFLLQFIWIKVPQIIITFIAMLINCGIKNNWAMLHDWNVGTIVTAFAGYPSKALLTQFVVKILNSALKNITEACAMVVVTVWNAFIGDVNEVRLCYCVLVFVNVCFYVYVKMQVEAKRKLSEQKSLEDNIAVRMLEENEHKLENQHVIPSEELFVVNDDNNLNTTNDAENSDKNDDVLDVRNSSNDFSKRKEKKKYIKPSLQFNNNDDDSKNTALLTSNDQ